MADAQAPAQSKNIGYRVGFYLIALLVLFCLILTPFAFSSLLADIFAPPTDHAYKLTPADVQPADSYSRLHVDVINLNEVDHLVTLRVNGFHVCAKDCTYTDKVLFFSVKADAPDAESIPPSAGVMIPATTAEVSGKIELPISGNLVRYPFDRYPLWLGVVVERETADKKVRILTPAETKGQLVITVQEQVARTVVTGMKTVNPQTVKPPQSMFDYAYVSAIELQRPTYLKIVVILVVLLIAAAAIYAMLMRPFDQLIINTGGLVLGVWGARSMLLGGYPADSTAVDITLTMVIMLLLGGISFRGLNYLHQKAGLNILPWARTKPAPEQEAVPAKAVA